MKRRYIFLLIIILTLTTLVLTACVPNKSSKAKEKMEKAGYSVLVYDAGEFSEEPEKDGVVDGVLVFNPVIKEYLIVIYFNSRVNAKKSYDYYLNNFENQFESEDLKFKTVLSGKCIYIGTPKAIEDFKAI